MIKVKLTNFKDFVLSIFNKPTPPSDPPLPTVPSNPPSYDDSTPPPLTPSTSTDVPSYPGNPSDSVVTSTPMFSEVNDLDRIRNFSSNNSRGYVFNQPGFFDRLFNNSTQPIHPLPLEGTGEGSTNLPSNDTTPTPSNQATPTQSPFQPTVPLPADSHIGNESGPSNSVMGIPSHNNRFSHLQELNTDMIPGSFNPITENRNNSLNLPPIAYTRPQREGLVPVLRRRIFRRTTANYARTGEF